MGCYESCYDISRGRDQLRLGDRSPTSDGTYPPTPIHQIDWVTQTQKEERWQSYSKEKQWQKVMKKSQTRTGPPCFVPKLPKPWVWTHPEMF